MGSCRADCTLSFFFFKAKNEIENAKILGINRWREISQGPLEAQDLDIQGGIGPSVLRVLHALHLILTTL